MVYLHESLTYFARTFGFVFQCLLQIFTTITYLLYNMTFTFKATDVRANNVKVLHYMAKTLLRPASHPHSAANVCITRMRGSAIRSVRSQWQSQWDRRNFEPLPLPNP